MSLSVAYCSEMSSMGIELDNKIELLVKFTSERISSVRDALVKNTSEILGVVSIILRDSDRVSMMDKGTTDALEKLKKDLLSEEEIKSSGLSSALSELSGNEYEAYESLQALFKLVSSQEKLAVYLGNLSGLMSQYLTVKHDKKYNDLDEIRSAIINERSLDLSAEETTLLSKCP